MADEEKNEETPEETGAAPEPEATEPEAAEPEAAEPDAAAEPEAAEPEPAAADVEAEEERPAGDAAPPPPALSKAEQRQAAKQSAASQRPARTPEERHSEREAERKHKAEQRRRRRVKEREKAKAAKKAAPAEQPVAAVHAETTGQPKVRTGRVVSDKAEQTITVRIEIARRHRRYEKIVRSTSTLHAHDPSNDAHEGDLVRVVEARPLSKTKRWRLVEVLERAR